MLRLTHAFLMALALAAASLAGPSAQTGLPTPESVIGFAPCADYKLATYEQIADYFHRLDRTTDRMQIQEIGKTAEGRPQIMAIISSEANMKQLGRFKDIASRLAKGRRVTDDQARALAREGKAIAWIDFGLHSTEVAHGQTAALMAYRAVSDDSDEMTFIRENVIFLLLPNMNPDGTTLVADWYMKHVGTPYEKSSPPELYQKYVGHDNNRDWYMFNMPESRNVAKQLYVEWFPQIVYNQHQAGPFPSRIFVPPFDDPMNPNIPPLVMRGINTVGDAITRRLDQEGKRGAVSRIEFDTWWNGGMRSAPYFHNMVGILTETGHASATPAVYDAKTFPRTFSNGVPTLEPTTYYPSPYLGGEWHLRDSCNIMVTASMAVLDIAAKRRQEWLYDIYQMGRDAIRAGAAETYVVPADQWDSGTAVKMINVLRMGGVDVERATAPFQAGGKQYAAGSFIIRGAQPFLPYVRDLLNPQVYPDRRLYPGGPPDLPYDITGWTLSKQMGVAVDRIASTVDATTEPVSLAALPASAVPTTAKSAYLIDPRDNDAFVAVNRLLKGGDQVDRSNVALHGQGGDWPAGTFIVPSTAAATPHLQAAVRGLGVRVGVWDGPLPEARPHLKSPRVGLYHGWGGNIDEGWTRWVFEQFEFPYVSLYDKDVRAGELRSRFDVIVLPDASYDSMLSGLSPGSMPTEYTGGMTAPGVANLYEFVENGGTLVAMDSAGELPITAFGLPIRNAISRLPTTEFFIPGTLLRVHVDNTQPIGYGMPEEATAFFANSPAYALGRRSQFEDDDEPGQKPARPAGVTVIAEYPGKDLLTSGWLLGEGYLTNKAAVVQAEVGKGRVVLLGFRTQHRGQPHGTFKLLFNSLYLGGSDAPPMGGAASKQPLGESRIPW